MEGGGPATSTTASIAFNAAIAAGEADSSRAIQLHSHGHSGAAPRWGEKGESGPRLQRRLPSSSEGQGEDSAPLPAPPATAPPSSSAGPSSASSASALSVLRGGSYLTRYEWRVEDGSGEGGGDDGGGGAVVSSDVFVWLSGEGRSARLYWCSAVEAAARAEVRRSSVSVRSITDLMLKRKTEELTAAGVADDCSFALLANTGVSLHLEAANPTVAAVWKDGLMASLRDTGKHLRRVTDTHSADTAGAAAGQPQTRAAPHTPHSPSPPLTAVNAATSATASTPILPSPLPSSASPVGTEAENAQKNGVAPTSSSSSLSSSSSTSSPSSSLSSFSRSSVWWLSVLTAGDVFRIYGKNSRRDVECNRMRVFYVPPEGADGGIGHLYWTSPSDSSPLPQQSLWLGSVHSVTWRKDSGLLRSAFAAAARSDLCFSILTASRHLHLEAANFHTVKQWMHALHLAFALHHIAVDMPHVIVPAAADAASGSSGHRSSSPTQPPLPAEAPPRTAAVTAARSPQPGTPSTPSSPSAVPPASLPPSAELLASPFPSSPAPATPSAPPSPWSAPSTSSASPAITAANSPSSSPSLPFLSLPSALSPPCLLSALCVVARRRLPHV